MMMRSAANRGVVIGAGLLFAFCMVLNTSAQPASDDIQQIDLFISGEGGYHTYRIPAIVTTTRGTILAFCEGRKNNSSDTGDIDLLMRRSVDGGQTWSPHQVIMDDGGNTCGNPCPVVDHDTGVIWMLTTWNDGETHESRIQPGYGPDSRRVFVMSSDDDGITWSEPREITREVKKPNWGWYATGPGAGIQIEHGPHAGRIVIPCDHKTHTADAVRYYSHVIYSDDHGRSWKLGGATPTDQVNECEVVELTGNRLLLNMRNYDRTQRTRKQSISHDGGMTWSAPEHVPTLIEPICQASLRRYRWPGPRWLPGVILFSNPASRERRERLTVRASFDDGATWPTEVMIYEGSSAYSCLNVHLDGTIGCLYERDGYGRITYATWRPFST